MKNLKFSIITFYQFKQNNELEKIKRLLKHFCSFHKIKGTILLAYEGINGTVAGLSEPIKLLEEELKDIGFNGLELKHSYYAFIPFNRIKIKIKKEIVTFDYLQLDVENSTAQHISSDNWNDLIQDKDTVLIDVRNDFEYKMGTFLGAINPRNNNFSDFKIYVDSFLSKKKDKKIAIFCTGGIRCEKASSYMLNKGFKNLFQLKGGILQYLKDTTKENSAWLGECFVFDNRVSIQNELLEGTYELCHGCRYPVNLKDRSSKHFVKGISCPKCYNKTSDEKKIRLQERNKQIKISKKMGLYNPYIQYTTTDFS